MPAPVGPFGPFTIPKDIHFPTSGKFETSLTLEVEVSYGQALPQPSQEILTIATSVVGTETISNTYSGLGVGDGSVAFGLMVGTLSTQGALISQLLEVGSAHPIPTIQVFTVITYSDNLIGLPVAGGNAGETYQNSSTTTQLGVYDQMLPGNDSAALVEVDSEAVYFIMQFQGWDLALFNPPGSPPNEFIQFLPAVSKLEFSGQLITTQTVGKKQTTNTIQIESQIFSPILNSPVPVPQTGTLTLAYALSVNPNGTITIGPAPIVVANL